MFDDDQTKNTASTPPGNLPTEPVDMFADVEKDSSAKPASVSPGDALTASDGVASPTEAPDALAAGRLKKRDSVVKAMPNIDEEQALGEVPDYKMSEPILGKIILLVLAVAVLIGLGFGGWWVYNNFVAKKIVETTPDITSPVTTSVEAEETKIENDTTTETEVKATESVETEDILVTTTDITNQIRNDSILFGESVDTDKDGLDDAREEQIGTDPKKSDSDSDGLNDGDEVIIWKTNPLKADSDGDGYKDGDEIKNGYNPLGTGELFKLPANTSTKKATTSEA